MIILIKVENVSKEEISIIDLNHYAICGTNLSIFLFDKMKKKDDHAYRVESLAPFVVKHCFSSSLTPAKNKLECF